MFVDYLGSYQDMKRALDEMKRSQEDSSEGESTEVKYSNVNFGKEPPPIVKLESEDQKQKFNTDFEKAMKNTFGESYTDTKVVTPAKGDESIDDQEDIDEIIVR